MIKKLIYVSFLFTLFVSCATEGISSKTKGAWAYNKTPECTAQLGSIQVDKTASYSVEHEIAVLLPLLFLEHNIVFPADGRQADYIVDVHASERDCTFGWNVRKSLSLEVYLRRQPLPAKNAREAPNEAPEAANEAANEAAKQDETAGKQGGMPEKKIVITAPPKNVTAFEVVTPDAAARIRASGKFGFSSSKNLEYLLRVCVKEAAAQIRDRQAVEQ
ncbi:MAG: hypothetical protein LBG72_01920 [Spirochaetaceae bacterium]|jgi:hypothetical protein|nr:hypothetical protein [Spirochaetaceae bacterium]